MKFETIDQYTDARNKLDAYESARLEWCKQDGQNINKGTSIPTEIAQNLPFGKEVTNELRSALEVWDFCHDIPQNYFLYIKREGAIATTWTGQKLGSVSFGRSYYSNFGDKRTPVTIYAINGRKYHGTFYESSGDYARVKLAK